MNALLHTKFKLVPGYPGTKAIHLALERREMMGAGGSTWAGLNSSDPDWIAKKLIRLLVQTGPRKEPDLPDVPLLKELPETQEGNRSRQWFLSQPASVTRIGLVRMFLPIASQPYAKPIPQPCRIRTSSQPPPSRDY